MERLLERILIEAKDLTDADGGTLYLCDENDGLEFVIVRNDTLGIALGGDHDKDGAASVRHGGDEPALSWSWLIRHFGGEVKVYSTA